jgi:hypothetical protein
MRQAAIGAAGVGAILLTLAGVENWSMGQPSTRS